jgi:chemotaxis protein MotB
VARKKKEEAPPSQGWKDTFSDLMNLLLCFFVLLFASSNVDEAKFDEIAASFQSTFSIFQAGSTAVGDGVLISNGVSQLNELSEFINSMGAMADNDEIAEKFDELQNELEAVEQAKMETSEQLAEQIEEALNENNIGDEVDIDFNSQYVQLTLRGAILFDPGSAKISEGIVPTLRKVGMILDRYAEYEIEIEGHTDNVPQHNSQYASNDELSSARALSVFEFFVANTGLSPALMKHSGRGEYVPIADNSTAEGRDRNRRVEIKIYHALSNY